MKETIIKARLSQQHARYLLADACVTELGQYKASRGMDELVDNKIGFDFYSYLNNLCAQNPNRKIEVLEGGCGQGWALCTLKRGLPYRGTAGLGDKIRTTGVSLSLHHAELARESEESYRPDEMIIGPVEQCTFDRQYDFIFDSVGAAFYFEEKVISVYSRLLKRGSFAFLRLLAGTEKKLEWLRNLFEQNGFEVIKEGGDWRGHMDFLVKR